MENLDSTVLSTALPAIAKDFGESPIHLKLALTSYLLAIAVFLPASGWLADRYGARTIFRLAIALFTIGSILCGFSGSIGSIVFARVIQGIGGAMMVPVGRLVILKSVAKHELVGSLAWLTVPALVGPVVGPPLGGFITTYFQWRWIFWINVPVGLLGLALATLFIPNLRGEAKVRFDKSGFALSAVGLAAFMTGSTSLGLGLLPQPVVLALFLGGAGLLLAYIRHSRQVAAPILDLSLFRIKSFAMCMIGALLFRLGLGATPFLLPLLLQVGFGMSPFKSGSITFAAAVGAIAMKFSAASILRRLGFRNVLTWNTLIAAGFLTLPAFFTPTTPIALDRRASAYRWLLPFAAIHRHQRSELCRHPAGAHEPRDHIDQRRAAIVAEPRHLDRRHDDRIHLAADRRGARCGFVPPGLPPSRRPDLAFDRAVPAPVARRRRRDVGASTRAGSRHRDARAGIIYPPPRKPVASR